jgi:hypothetical protein
MLELERSAGDSDDVPTAFGQCLHAMRPEKASRAGHQDASCHFSTLPLRFARGCAVLYRDSGVASGFRASGDSVRALQSTAYVEVKRARCQSFDFPDMLFGARLRVGEFRLDSH